MKGNLFSWSDLQTTKSTSSQFAADEKTNLILVADSGALSEADLCPDSEAAACHPTIVVREPIFEGKIRITNEKRI